MLSFKPGQWAWSEDHERFSGEGFSTKDGAIADAVREGSYVEIGSKILVGKIKTPDEPSIDGCWIIEHLVEEMFENAGECTENWTLEPSDGKQGLSLETALNASLMKWLRENGHWPPNFYEIEDGSIEEIEIDEEIYSAYRPASSGS